MYIQIKNTIFVNGIVQNNIILYLKMAKQVKIKDIAQMAGVSVGTVDRVLHNRGNVSEKSLKAIEQVLSEVGYKYNIHTSAISLRKEYKIAIAIPTAIQGEYWGAIQDGIMHAINEYSDVKLDCRFFFYNQFDIYSCRSSFASIIDQRPEAVIIGPTFKSETQRLCAELDANRIPYVFVDAVIEGTSPVASYSTDQFTCGRLLGRLLRISAPKDAEFAIMSSQRIGNERSNNSLERRKGFIGYFRDNGMEKNVKETSFSVFDPAESEKKVMRFLKENPGIKGMAVMNSRGYILAEILKANNVQDISLVSFDLTLNNIKGIEDGSISAILCQRPELQGFHALKSLIKSLLYNQEAETVHHIMPIDIIVKENLPYYREFFEM